MCEYELRAKAARLVWLAQPRILPGSRDVLVVAAKSNVRAIAIAELQSLMFGDGDGDGASDAGVRLTGKRTWYAVHTRTTTEPEIAVDRCPEPWLEIVAQVSFKRTNWVLRLGSGAGKVDVARPEIVISGEEPHSEVSIEDPFARPAL